MRFNGSHRPGPPAVVEEDTEEDEDQQGHGAKDGQQEDGVVGGDVTEARGV